MGRAEVRDIQVHRDAENLRGYRRRFYAAQCWMQVFRLPVPAGWNRRKAQMVSMRVRHIRRVKARFTSVRGVLQRGSETDERGERLMEKYEGYIYLAIAIGFCGVLWFLGVNIVAVLG